MNKKEFFALFREELSGLPKDDLDERVAFYEEIINDKMDEGKTEEQAIAELGSVESIVEQIASETSLVKLVKEKYKPKRALKGWEIALLIAGFPLWFPLALTFFILVFVFYVLTWLLSIIAASIEIAFVSTSVAGLISFFALLFTGSFELAPLGVFLGCTGATILFAFVCYYAVKANIKLSKGLFIAIKKSFMKRREK